MNEIAGRISILLAAGAMMWGVALQQARGQGHTVTGTVVSAADAMPLPGANIAVKGTTTGTAADNEGRFRIVVPDANSVLVVSFIGFETREIPVGGRSTIDVELAAAAIMGDEVVVTALGLERTRKSVGYAVSEVNTEDVVQGTEANVSNLLQGRIPGVTVSATPGGPGTSTRVTIRGASDLAGDNQPLYVVDGIPIDNSNIGSAGSNGGFDGGDGISSINPEDIERISVLKGAAAAALYGTRARDGVVLITTKSGRGASDLDVQFSSTTTIEEALLGFEDFQTVYGQGSNGAKPQTQEGALATARNSWGARLDGSTAIQFDGVERPYENTGSRLGQFYQRGLSTKNTLSISGGSENSSYYFSASHLNAESIMPGSGLERLSLTLRNRTSIGRLTADVKANYSDETADNRPRISNSPGNANFMITFLPANVSPRTLEESHQTEEGLEILPTNSVFTNNPYWVTNKFSTDDDKDRLIGHVKLDYDLTDWLTLTGRTGLDWYTLRRTDHIPWGTGFRPGGELREEDWRVLENNTDVLLSAVGQFSSDLAVSATVGGSRRYHRTEQVGQFGSDFKVPGLVTISNLQNVVPMSAFSRKQINSVYGSADFSYADFLFLSVTGRNDWSSTLPADANSFFYPSLSGSFVWSDAFGLPSWLSFGKLRASWAEVGNDTDPFMLNLSYDILNVTHLDQSLATVAQRAVPLTDLKPTSTQELEAGIEVQFFGGRLGLDGGWYDRKTIDQILATDVSHTTGFRSRVINAGRLDNHGVELLLTGVPLRTPAALWTSTINLSRNWSEVKALTEDQEVLILDQSRTGDAWITAEVGYEFGTIWGFKYLRDEAGNIVHENGLPLRDPERAVLGKGTPDWTGGWSNAFTYKNLTLVALIDFRWGGQIYSPTNAVAYITGLHKNTLTGRAACDAIGGPDGWPSTGCFIGEGVDVGGGANETAVLPDAYFNRIGSQIAEEFVYDANTVKLREVAVSYRLPASLIARSPLKSASVTLIGRNLFYLRNPVPNVDPEILSINRGNAQGLGSDGMPNTRSIGIKFDARF